MGLLFFVPSAAERGATLTHPGREQRGAALGEPPERYVGSASNADRFAALKADRVRIGPPLESVETDRGESTSPPSRLTPLLLAVL